MKIAKIIGLDFVSSKPMKNQIITLLFLFCVFTGCSNQPTNTKTIAMNSDLIDSSVSDFHNLGWLGIRCYPMTANLSFADPGDSDISISPGGLIVSDVISDSPAEKAGFKKDDVIVGVEDKWVPIKDDPTLDVLQQLETRVTSAEAESTLKVYRDGELIDLTVENLADSLDDGLPSEVVRFVNSAKRGVDYLVTLQNSDGSFGTESFSLDSRLQITAISGLALLSVKNEQNQSAVDKCKQYIAARLDQMSSTPEATPAEQSDDVENDSAGVIQRTFVQMPELEIDPLTASYVAQFLSESNVSMLDQKWMGRLIGLAGALSKTQAENGGWNTADDSEEGSVDIAATFVSNQCLLAIGMLERMGVSANPETVKNACEFLKSQLPARAGSPVDRRVKAALTAGTGVALYAINCQPSDSFLEQTIEDGLELVREMHMSPSLNLPGLLSTAVLARQAGDGKWVRFHEDAKLYLTAAASPDGQFFTPPGSNQQALEFEAHSDDAAWQAAHYCLILAMQSSQLKSLTAQKKSPMMVARNSAGEASKGGSAGRPGMPPNLPGGSKTMSFSLDNLSGEGSLEDQIKEKLKEMGIDSSNIKMSTLPGQSDTSKEKEKTP